MRKIAIIGGGPAGLFMYKRLVEKYDHSYSVDIFEAKAALGSGMPYSYAGANLEHVTNVSGNEIPWLVTSLKEWIHSVSDDTLKKYNLQRSKFHDYMVIPRLLFGEYLNDQFYLLKKQADAMGLITSIHINTAVTDISDAVDIKKIHIEINQKEHYVFHQVIICTGHNWPKSYEDKVAGYFDSPYPPVKLKFAVNHTVAIRGSSLTAIDAVRTIARYNGNFIKTENDLPEYVPNENAADFKIILHSRNGLLPAIRFHLEDSHLRGKGLLTKKEILEHRKSNNGFLSLDYIFDKDFKAAFIEKDKSFYAAIKDLNMEDFVSAMMALREKEDAFELFKKEYDQAATSIKLKQSVYWKEALAVLSFAMNYPAKHFSAEDMLRLQKVLKPLIALVIAFVPQGSAEELLALHAAGKLMITAVGDETSLTVKEKSIAYTYTDANGKLKRPVYKTFIDCIGQPALKINDFPFKSLVNSQGVSQAKLPFRSADIAKKMKLKNKKIKKKGNDFYLDVPGIAISDCFRVLDKNGKENERIYLMAVPYIGGFNPDYSGLDFCEEASGIISEALF